MLSSRMMISPFTVEKFAYSPSILCSSTEVLALIIPGNIRVQTEPSPMVATINILAMMSITGLELILSIWSRFPLNHTRWWMEYKMNSLTFS